MRPETQNFDRFLFLEDLIDQAVLNVDAAAMGALQITDQLFIRWGTLKGVLGQDVQQGLDLRSKSRRGDFLGVFSGLSRVNKRPTYHARRLERPATGALSPRRMDWRIPGTERR